MLFEILLPKKFGIWLNPQFSVPWRNLKNSPKRPPFCFMTKFEENGSSGCCDVYPGRSNILRPLISFRMVQYTFEKCAELPSRSAIGCCSNTPDLKKDILYNLLAMIGQWNNKDINNGWFCWTETSKLSLWEPLKNSHWNLFRRLSNAIFKNFLLKANQQFVEILPTTYIFQSRSIYNIAGKVVWSIKTRYDQIYWCVNRSQLYAANQHLFLFRFR